LRFVLRQALTLAMAGILIGAILTAGFITALAPGTEMLWAMNVATFLTARQTSRHARSDARSPMGL